MMEREEEHSHSSNAGNGNFDQHDCVGRYEEKRWVEMEEDEEDDINCLGMFDDPDPFEVFIHEFNRKEKDGKSSTFTISLEGYKSENGQQLNSTGLTLWRAAPILCEFISDNAEKYIKNKCVLELGAGLGLCGILAAALGAETVFMTDGDTPSLERMRENVSRNMSLTTRNGLLSDSLRTNIVHCKQLRWGQELEAFKQHCALKANKGCFDVIMGSDIIYTEDILDPLFGTIDFLLKRNSSDDIGAGDKGLFILAYARRNVKIDHVFEVASKYGFFWESPKESEGCFLFWRAHE